MSRLPSSAARSDAKYSVRSSAENLGVSSLLVVRSNGSGTTGAHGAPIAVRDVWYRSFFPVIGSAIAYTISSAFEVSVTSSSIAWVAATVTAAGADHRPAPASSEPCSSAGLPPIWAPHDPSSKMHDAMG